MGAIHNPDSMEAVISFLTRDIVWNLHRSNVEFFFKNEFARKGDPKIADDTCGPIQQIPIIYKAIAPTAHYIRLTPGLSSDC
jgi:hypothetical protein